MLQTGFILSRQLCYEGSKQVIEFYLKTEEGALCVRTEPQPFVFFSDSSQGPLIDQIFTQANLLFSQRDVAMTSFEHQPTTAFYFTKQSIFKHAVTLCKSANIAVYEADIRVVDRFLMERFIQGSTTVMGDWDNHQRKVVNAKCKQADFRPVLTVLSLDIECSENGELYSVGLVMGCERLVIMVDAGSTQATHAGILWVDSPSMLLKEMIRIINLWDPDLIAGWNIINFDFRVLWENATRLGVPLTIGRDGSEIFVRKGPTDSNQYFVTIPGRVVIDGIDALKTATYSFESFSLEHVSQTLLGEGKATDDVDTRLAKITHDFNHNKLALAHYNLKDCELVLSIFEKTNIIDFLVLRSELTGLALDRVGGSVAAFTNLYLPKLHRAGYVSPNLPADGGLASPGGYVMQSKPGLYQHILVLDFKSLYPAIIRTFNIDPMGLIEGLKHPDNAIPGFRGAMFSRDRHFLPDIVAKLWQQRDIAKQQKDDARSRAIKIIMNSMYGVLGSGGCRFYDTRLASSITLRGHEIMQTTAKWIETMGYEVIYGDTDSTFVRIKQQVSSEEANLIGVELAKTINQKWQHHIEQRFSLPCYLELEFETCFDQFLMPTIRGSEAGSKKRYAGTCIQNGKSQLIFKGMESVRSDWTPLAKQFQTSLYQMIFDNKDVSTYIQDIVNKTRAGKLDHELVYRKRLRRPLQSYQVNVPPHVRAARLADEWYREQGRAPRYQQRGVIQYVITLSGPQPLENITSAMDYDHYIGRQLAPIADAILPFVDLDFNDLVSDQMKLF